MTAIRAIFDGKAFVPREPVSLPAEVEALVLVANADPAAQQQLDEAVRAYYQSGSDAEDEDWGRAAAQQSQQAWEEH